MRDFKEYLQTIIDYNGYDLKIGKVNEIVTTDEKSGTFISTTKNEMCLILTNYGNESLREIFIRNLSDSKRKSIEFVFLIQKDIHECNISINIRSDNTIRVRYCFGDTIMSIEQDNAKLVMHNYKNSDDKIIRVSDFNIDDVFEKIKKAVQDAYQSTIWVENIDILLKVIESALFMCITDFKNNWENSLPDLAKRLSDSIDIKNKEIEQLTQGLLSDKTGMKDREYNRAVRKRKELLAKLWEVREAIKYLRDRKQAEYDNYLIDTMGGYRR